MLRAIRLLRNLGTFDSVEAGAQLPLARFALVYAENGRGKTTLAAALRSLGTGDPVPVLERRRLGSQHDPHIVMEDDTGQRAVFENGAWANRFGDISVFDDRFVTDNVCSGMVVETTHRQNLHELIIGAQGVALSTRLQGHVDRIEQHNRDLQARANAILAEARGPYNVEDFCALENRENIDDAVHEAERALAAARDSDAVHRQTHFEPITLPAFDLDAVGQLLSRGLPDLEADAAARVQAHLARIGDGGEAWVREGMERIAPASAGEDNDVCPFCAQDLAGSALITHYQAYFSDAYQELNRAIAAGLRELNTAHSADIQTAFERAVRVAIQTRQFWARFTDVPEVTIDTARVSRAWKEAFDAVSAILRAKQAAPLETAHVDEDLRAKVTRFHALRDEVIALSNALTGTRPEIDLVKERAAAADVAALDSDLKTLKAIQARYRPDIVPLCDDYLREKAAKNATEERRDQARAALNQYREQVFPAYEAAINEYLRRFNAGFRLHRVTSVNTRAGSSCNYSVLINQVPVPLSAAGVGEPAFRNTMSAGDRNTLALAFFFAALDRDPNRNGKIIIIDDPMTSLDEHRALTTIHEMRRLAEEVQQVIVLSHTKPFLCDLWQGADTALRSAMKIARANPGSTLAPWDINQDCITEHDRRHATVREYIDNPAGADERAVAVALRPILESFMRVAYPQYFPPGTFLGPFIGLCQQRERTPGQILSPADRVELRALLDYANRFHHDTNPAWQTAAINDHELLDFARRTLAFTRR